MLRDRSLIPLSRQHHNGLALCVLTERSLRADSSAANVERLARRAVDRYELELTNHFALEEELLFPEMAERSCIVTELLAEHRRLESLIEELRKQPGAARLLEFTALLRAHIRKEENDLFEQTQRELPRDLLDALGRQLESRTVKVCL